MNTLPCIMCFKPRPDWAWGEGRRREEKGEEEKKKTETLATEMIFYCTWFNICTYKEISNLIMLLCYTYLLHTYTSCIFFSTDSVYTRKIIKTHYNNSWTLSVNMILISWSTVSNRHHTNVNRKKKTCEYSC